MYLFGLLLGVDSWVVVGEIGGVCINNMFEYDELCLNVVGMG